MKAPFVVTIDDKLFNVLMDHLFPGDDDEHGAIICVGVSVSAMGTRLLAREVFLAEDGIDYVPGERGYRALTAKFVAEKAIYCADNGLGYLAVHCHRGNDYVQFSSDDYASHKRGYGALLNIISKPVGALVFALNAVAGEIWTEKGNFKLDHLTVIGSRIKNLYPEPQTDKQNSDFIYNRHTRLFGEAGQSIISNLKVGIIGLGGGGSLLNEWLSRLGVGTIIAIDYQKIEGSNLPRIVGSSRWHALTWLTKSRFKWVQSIGRKYAKYKVHVAEKVAKQANPQIHYTAIVGDIKDEGTALKLKDVDFIFLATDNITSRNIFNSILHQYLIPGAQVGAKVRSNAKTKEIIGIHTAGRLILPYQKGGCLFCNGWIPSGRLQKELLSEEERKAQNYVEDEDVVEPSVITLNVLSASQVINDFMMMFTGLYDKNLTCSHLLTDVLNRQLLSAEMRYSEDCLFCSTHVKSRFAIGDGVRLPCKQISSSQPKSVKRGPPC